MEKDELLVTEEGYNELVNELETRKSQTRREIAARIKVALAEGDLSENAEYSESKEEQNKNESRIVVLEALLKKVKIVRPDENNKDTIQIGSKVKVKDLEFDEDMDYMIVGATEANPNEGKISNLSPLGAALLGKKAGDMIDVTSPGGIVKYKIISMK